MYNKIFPILLAFSLILCVHHVSAQDVDPLNIFRGQAVKTPHIEIGSLKMMPDDSVKSLTDVQYLFGSQESQFLNFKHSQLFSKKAELHILYANSASEGNLVNDVFKYSNLILNGNYQGDKFKLTSSLKFEQDAREENGGILNDSLFDQTDLAQKFIEVNLTSNSSDCKKLVVQDTLEYKISKNVLFGSFLNFKHLDRNYTGTGVGDTTFYQNVFIDSSGRVDYYRNRNLNYGLGLSLIIGKNKFAVGSVFNSDYYFNRSKQDTFGVGLYAVVQHVDSGLVVGLNAKYHLNGFRKDGFEIKFGYEQELRSKLKIRSDFKSELLPISYSDMRFSGNYYNWDFDSSKYQFANLLDFNLSDSSGNWNIGGELLYTQNYFYFDTVMNPSQVSGVGSIRVDFKKNFKLGMFKIPIGLVSYPLMSYEIRNPLVSISSGVLFRFEAFKSNLKVETGITANWFSRYYARTYEPSTGRYYLQDEQKIGNYPYLDFILKTSIKDASFFIIVTHLNQDLTGRNYFSMPRYLELQRRFVFGLKWRFIN